MKFDARITAVEDGRCSSSLQKIPALDLQTNSYEEIQETACSAEATHLR
ncbi:hypothetical protein J7E83_17770 [Arthrobacter sp. ISL-48]|nr:hypothetical protein [Arthrobacter sp. ISL-48]MBT2533939.1 hypothetical protein [Arthrobacter sp. ISL-48]